MGSTVRSATQSAQPQGAAAPVRWRSWPLADYARWSWLVPLGIIVAGIIVFWLGGSWVLAVAASAALATTLWHFLLPVSFEVCSSGLRRFALGRVRLVSWQAIRAYQLRSTGIVLFQRPDPTKFDLLSSLFVPYPRDEDEMLIAVRSYLSHAIELP